MISISLPSLIDWGLKIEGKVGLFMSNMPSKIESGILTLQSSSIIYFGLFSKRNVCDSIPNWFDENQRDRSKNESQFQDNEGRVHWGDCGSTSHSPVWLPSKGLHEANALSIKMKINWWYIFDINIAISHYNCSTYEEQFLILRMRHWPKMTWLTYLSLLTW